jgi:hypothetical protein
MARKPLDWLRQPNILIAIAFALMLIISSALFYFEGGG